MKILIVDDEKSILKLINFNLRMEGFTTITAENGREAIELYKYDRPDLVILDISLPDINGYDVFREMQLIDITVPIIFLTAKTDQNDKLLGLQLGADDYITKPFDNKELILRIRAIIRRSNINNDLEDKKKRENEICIGDLKIYKKERKVYINEREIIATYKEFDTLLLLASNPGKVFTREELLERVWGYDYEGGTRSVDILIRRIREKFKSSSEYIATIYGVGYKLEEPV